MNKDISKKRLMDALYDSAYTENSDDNVIETEELKKAYDAFYDKYIEPIDSDCEIWDKFNEVVFGFCRRGFDVGFEAAISLLTGAEWRIHGKECTQ